MLTLGLGMGGLLFGIGLITYVFAPKVGPNPIFGVRVGYSYANREVWDKTNRFGGTLIALVGLMVALLAPVLQWLNLSEADGIRALTALMLAAILGSVIWLFIYARDLAQGTIIAREMAPVHFRWAFLAPVLVTMGLLVAVALYFYPVLPVDRLATHFNLDNRPDGWSTRDGFLMGFFGMAGLFVLLNAAVVFIATREPIIALGRWGSTWRLDPERGLIYTGVALGFANLILLVALWDIAWFNTRGVHAFPLSIFLWLLVPIIAMFVGLFFLLGRRER
ncbi:MAG: SdpI family protein [Acidobacteriota bacterium]